VATDARVEETTMSTIAEAATSFLGARRIAVTGVSRDGKHGANVVFARLKERGYDVFAVNPNATDIDGVRCYPDLRSIPDGVEAVVIGTRADRAEATMRECADLGIDKVWMHRSFGPGSVSDEATEFGRQRGIQVIDGGCPLMFAPTDDGFHRVFRHVCTWTGKVPRLV
jgi:uncharacterized protein